MEEFLKTVENLRLDTTHLAIFISLFVGLISIVLYLLFKRSSSDKNLVLLLGISNSGKTTLFTQLVYKKTLFTQTSITQNSGTAILETDAKKEKRVELVDIPGNDKIRKKFLDTYKKNAKALVFVVDSTTLQKDLKDVALYLYDCLVDDHMSRAKLKVLIVCNKQDIEFAKGESVVRSSLEKEIELLRKISTSALESTGADNKSKTVALRSGSDQLFNFDDLKYFKIDFEESSCQDLASINKTIVSWMNSRL